MLFCTNSQPDSTSPGSAADNNDVSAQKCKEERFLEKADRFRPVVIEADPDSMKNSGLPQDNNGVATSVLHKQENGTKQQPPNVARLAGLPLAPAIERPIDVVLQFEIGFSISSSHNTV